MSGNLEVWISGGNEGPGVSAPTRECVLSWFRPVDGRPPLPVVYLIAGPLDQDWAKWRSNETLQPVPGVIIQYFS